MLSLRQIRVRHGQHIALSLEALDIDPSQFTVILGHNGSGKSTLLNLIARQQMPAQGEIRLDGIALERLSQCQLAQRVAYLPQRLPDVSGLTVRELVQLGRYPWRGLLGRWRQEDQQAVDRALHQSDTLHLADCLADSLSGGERHRAWIAMLLAQDAPLLLLDEPTAALDLAHQYELMALLARLNRERGCGVLVILHDVNLSCRYAQRIIALKRGTLFFDGTPAQLLDAERLSTLYDIDIDLLAQPGQARPLAVVR